MPFLSRIEDGAACVRWCSNGKSERLIDMVHIVLLSGGSGTRLWPLSNNSRAKQFLKVLRDEGGNHISMVQRVFQQIDSVQTELDITIATIASQQFSLESQIQGEYSLVLEPERRDTAPAIMLACSFLASRLGAKDDDTVVVMPIDTYADQAYYDSILKLDASVQSGASSLTLLGVEPTYPSEKYGYIVPARCEGLAWPVRKFVEKPAEQEAQELIDQGSLWNCGVFAFRLGFMMDVIRSYRSDAEYESLLVNYSQLPLNSFDYEVVEACEEIAVIPYRGVWKDLGTWNTLSEEMSDEASGRVVGLEETCENTHAINELGLPLVVLGLKDAVVVATHDGILVSDKQQSSYMKPYVERVAEQRPMYEQRRWGQYRVLDSAVFEDGKRSLTKELTIKAGEQLSYQIHQCRDEIWTIVSGTGQVVVGDVVQDVARGSVVKIPSGQAHSCRAFSELRIIEVQLGDMLEEADIIRYPSFWQ